MRTALGACQLDGLFSRALVFIGELSAAVLVRPIDPASGSFRCSRLLDELALGAAGHWRGMGTTLGSGWAQKWPPVGRTSAAPFAEHL